MLEPPKAVNKMSQTCHSQTHLTATQRKDHLIPDSVEDIAVACVLAVHPPAVLAVHKALSSEPAVAGSAACTAALSALMSCSAAVDM